MFRMCVSVLLAVVMIICGLSFSGKAQIVNNAEEGANIEIVETSALSETEYNNKINALMKQYKNGDHWYDSFDGGTQCYGFARLVAYNVFGSHVDDWSVSYSWDGIKAGDVVQYGNISGQGHTIFVLSISGDKIRFVDCNGNGNGVDAYGNWIPDLCCVKWDNTITIGANIFNSYSFSVRYVSPGVEPDITYAGFDVNFWVDGKERLDIDGIGTVYVYIDGKLQGYGPDFYQDVVVGKPYEIRIDITNPDYHFCGVDTTDGFGLTGITNLQGTRIRLVISKDSGGNQDIPDGDYLIASALDSQYGLDIAGDSLPALNMDNVELWTIGETIRKQDVFTVVNMDNGYYEIIQKDSQVAVDLYGADTSNNANISMYERNGSAAQQWKLSYDRLFNAYTIQAKCSGMYMTIENANVKAGTNIIQCTESSVPASQRWLLIPYAPANYILGDVDDDGEVDVIDATYIQRYDAGFTVPYSEEMILLCGDIDGDGDVGVIDVTLIQRYDAGFRVAYPIGEAIT